MIFAFAEVRVIATPGSPAIYSIRGLVRFTNRDVQNKNKSYPVA